jgi:CelD/BcsL family acetyltransferase involved in cellulose biosynthesis
MNGCQSKVQLLITPITETKAFVEIKKEWNALLAESRVNNIFLTWEWMHTWWCVYGHEYKLQIITVRLQSGKLVGIAPFKMKERNILGIHRERILEFIGVGEDVTTEYVDIIARIGYEACVYDKVTYHIVEKMNSTRVNLYHFSSTSSFIPVIKDCLENRKVKYILERFSSCPVISLPKTWESFMSGKSVNFRKKSKEYFRVAERDLGIRLVCCKSMSALQCGMDDLKKLHRKRWGDKSGKFKTNKYIAFHRKVSEIFLHKGWLRLFFLMKENQALAGIYCFYYGQKYYYYQSGRDPDFLKYRLGTVLLNESIKQAIGENAAEYDLLTGEESYKYRWANFSKETVRLSFSSK